MLTFQAMEESWISNLYLTMLVLSVKISTPWNTVVRDASNRIGSKYISLNVRDRCRKRVTQFSLVMFKELRLRPRSSKRHMTNHFLRQNSKKLNKSFQTLRKMTSNSFRPKKLIWVKVLMVKSNWLATKRTQSRLPSKRSKRHHFRPVKSRKHS